MRNAVIVTLLLLVSSLSVQGQNNESKGLLWSTLRNLEYRIKAGFNIGGTSPLPLPREIREINSYRPGMQIAVEGNVIKWLGDKQKWGVLLGVRMENKGMKTDARVKNYFIVMNASSGDLTGHMEGNWTGYVKTNVKNSYVTFPIQAIYKISDRWDIKFGPYLSVLTNGDFSGSAYEGYLRNENPVGLKVNVDVATYDFSSDIRKFNYGLDLGGEWKAYKHLTVYSDLTWALNSIFSDDFECISFKMYNIYLNFGFGYIF